MNSYTVKTEDGQSAITVGVEADSMGVDDKNNLVFYTDGEQVAIFRYWNYAAEDNER